MRGGGAPRGARGVVAPVPGRRDTIGRLFADAVPQPPAARGTLDTTNRSENPFPHASRHPAPLSRRRFLQDTASAAAAAVSA
ncbi:twin-arginine translocation signal domain-containing protein [Streptomyces angustmyceticus]|uniref:twin-arginine translocation signal domain-containing protein n=1 Tax=Streptomyces angustmyceticus TaxID=285578 RepID=UPI0036821A54